MFNFISLLIFILIYYLYNIYLSLLFINLYYLFIIFYFKLKNKQNNKKFLIILLLSIITFYFKNDIFIKLKPTIIYYFFSLLIILFYLFKYPFLKKLNYLNNIEYNKCLVNYLYGSFITFFITIGCLNIYIAFNYNTNFWLIFKMFGFIIIIINIFIIKRIILYKYTIFK